MRNYIIFFRITSNKSHPLFHKHPQLPHQKLLPAHTKLCQIFQFVTLPPAQTISPFLTPPATQMGWDLSCLGILQHTHRHYVVLLNSGYCQFYKPLQNNNVHIIHTFLGVRKMGSGFSAFHVLTPPFGIFSGDST